MLEYDTVARPYAKAAFDFALEQDNLDKWHNMLKFATAVATNGDMQNFLSISLSTDDMAKVFIDICADNIDQNGQNFIRILAENKRLLVLPNVLKLFEQLLNEHRKIVDIDVISARPLDDKQQDNIRHAMEKKLTRKVKLNCRVDEGLIGGIIIKTDEFEIDGSSRGQLQRLTNALQL